MILTNYHKYVILYIERKRIINRNEGKEMKEINMEKLSRVAEEEFTIFKKNMLEKSKEEIFEYHHKITFFNEMHEFFIGYGTESLKEHTLEFLVSLGNRLLECLYHTYLDTEYSSIHSWESICDWVNLYADTVKN